MGYEKRKFTSLMNILEHVKFEVKLLELDQEEEVDFFQFLKDEIRKLEKVSVPIIS